MRPYRKKPLFDGRTARLLCLVATFCVALSVPGLDISCLAEDASSSAQEDVPGILKKTKDLGPRGQIVLESVDFTNAELTSVLRSIAKVAGLNIITGPEVMGKVNIYWDNVTVQQALESILTTNGFGYLYEGNVLTVLPSKDLGEETVKTITRVIYLQYLDPQTAKTTIEDLAGGKQGGGSGSGGGGGSDGSQQRGSGLGSIEVGVQPEANAIVISGIPGAVEEIERVIKQMDKPKKQVRIDAKLVEFSFTDDFAVGMDWILSRNLDGIGDYGNLTGSFKLAPGGVQAGQFLFGYGNDPYQLMAFLQAQSEADRVRVLANPSILALDNRKASVRIMDNRPYVTTVVGGDLATESINYEEAGIELEVLPHITDDGYVLLYIKPTQKIIGPTVVLQNSTAFAVDERTAETELLVKDGQTAVIAGLRSNDVQKTIKKVPLLGDLKIIGKLFQFHSMDEKQAELIVFVTPHIVKTDGGELTESDELLLDHFEDMLPEVDIMKQERAAMKEALKPVYRVHQ